MESLIHLRRKIDKCNTELLAILNERAKVAIEIGQIKASAHLPKHDPHRESEILARLTERNDGPLTDEMIEKIFTEIMRANLALQEDVE